MITTVARARNTGMKYSEDKKSLLEKGEPPILLEPVNAKISINRSGSPTVYVLDHVGKRTGEKTSLEGVTVDLKGEKYKTIYYEMEY